MIGAGSATVAMLISGGATPCCSRLSGCRPSSAARRITRNIVLQLGRHILQQHLRVHQQRGERVAGSWAVPAPAWPAASGIVGARPLLKAAVCCRLISGSAATARRAGAATTGAICSASPCTAASGAHAGAPAPSSRTCPAYQRGHQAREARPARSARAAPSMACSSGRARALNTPD